MLIYYASMFGGGKSSNDETGLETHGINGGAERIKFLKEHLRSYPEAGTKDIYKFLHQSVFGPGHIIESHAFARKALLKEWDNMPPVEFRESPFELLRRSPYIVRINLRPYKKSAGSFEKLIEALFNSADEIKGEAQEMDEALNMAAGFIIAGGDSRTADEIIELGKRLKPEGYPPIHHSDDFMRYYKPAYRVLLIKNLPGLKDEK